MLIARFGTPKLNEAVDKLLEGARLAHVRGDYLVETEEYWAARQELIKLIANTSIRNFKSSSSDLRFELQAKGAISAGVKRMGLFVVPNPIAKLSLAGDYLKNTSVTEMMLDKAKGEDGLENDVLVFGPTAIKYRFEIYPLSHKTKTTLKADRSSGRYLLIVGEKKWGLEVSVPAYLSDDAKKFAKKLEKQIQTLS